MSFYKQQQESLKQAIIDQAIALFKDEGYDSVTVEDITKSVGIAKGTFYNYFPSKKDILMIWSEKQFQRIDINALFDPQCKMEINLNKLIEIVVSLIREERILFYHFLREVMQSGKADMRENGFDFKALLHLIITSSADAADMGLECTMMKANILNNALFCELLEWFDEQKPADMLESHLKNIVKICLYGIRSNLDGQLYQ